MKTELSSLRQHTNDGHNRDADVMNATQCENNDLGLHRKGNGTQSSCGS